MWRFPPTSPAEMCNIVIPGLGLFVGLTLGLTGAGGAIIAVPLLIFALNWDVARSAPVALVAVAASAALGTVLGLRQGCVRYRSAVVMAATGAVTTPLGLFIAQRLPAASLSFLFALVLFYVAWRMYNRTRHSATAWHVARTAKGALCQLNIATGRVVWTAPCARARDRSRLASGFFS